MKDLMQWYWYDFNNPKNVWWDYKVNMDLKTYETKWKILEKLNINYLDFWNPNKKEKEMIEQINTENIEFYHKIFWKIKFYKDTVGIKLNSKEIIFDKKQIWDFKTNYEKTEEKAKENNKNLLNEDEFIELIEIFEYNTKILKNILNINNDYIWWENWLIFNLSDNWNSWHIQYNTDSNKKIFRLGTIYKNKNL
jgi:hypothetical protein